MTLSKFKYTTVQVCGDHFLYWGIRIPREEFLSACEDAELDEDGITGVIFDMMDSVGMNPSAILDDNQYEDADPDHIIILQVAGSIN